MKSKSLFLYKLQQHSGWSFTSPQASVTEILPERPAAAVCVSAVCVSRMFLCDGDKLSLEDEVEVALLSMSPSSSVAVEEWNPAVTESVLLLLGVPAPRGPGRPSRSTDRDKPRTWFKNHVSMIFKTPKRSPIVSVKSSRGRGVSRGHHGRSAPAFTEVS